MFIKVNANLGFNSEQVGWWKYELPEPPPPPPPDPPLAARENGDEEPAAPHATPHAARGAARGAASRTEPPAPVQQVVLEPTLTLYMTTGGECVITGADAEKVRQYYSVPSSHLTVL